MSAIRCIRRGTNAELKAARPIVINNEPNIRGRLTDEWN